MFTSLGLEAVLRLKAFFAYEKTLFYIYAAEYNSLYFQNPFVYCTVLIVYI